jgi:hypothetical protein
MCCERDSAIFLLLKPPAKSRNTSTYFLLSASPGTVHRQGGGWYSRAMLVVA